MSLDGKLDLQALLDGLGQGVLLFTSEGKLAMDNLVARTILGTDLNVLREKGWSAASVLFNTRQPNPDETIDAIRARALKSERPIRFHTYHSGAYIPCWAAAVQTDSGAIYTMITLEAPDWAAFSDETKRFQDEMRDAIDATQGHIALITQTINTHKPHESGETLAKRISGFTRLISIHMHRVARYMEMMERLQAVRTNRIRAQVKQHKRKIKLASFLEDFLEELDEIVLLDPETETTDPRSRIHVQIDEKIDIVAAPHYVTRILRDVLRNAIMYSIKATPVKINVQVKNRFAQIDIIDEGYGVREKERERVFEPFQRARQPQIIGEFGYGLSLYLCKHEVEAMNGKMWFDSEESVGTTFSLTLPLWVEQTQETDTAPVIAVSSSPDSGASARPTT